MADVSVAVIGRGLIGSAAARHLAEAGVTTALVGPDEPVDRRASSGPFSSHADEGRITRIAGRTALWSEVAARSIARYSDIETRSGIPFHTSCGLVSVFATAADWGRAGSASRQRRPAGRGWVGPRRVRHHPDERLASHVRGPAGGPHQPPPVGGGTNGPGRRCGSHGRARRSDGARTRGWLLPHRRRMGEHHRRPGSGGHGCVRRRAPGRRGRRGAPAAHHPDGRGRRRLTRSASSQPDPRPARRRAVCTRSTGCHRCDIPTDPSV